MASDNDVRPPALEPEHQEELERLACKRNGFMAVKDQVRILAIGSSHGAYCFDARLLPGAYNLCSTSQDLAHSRRLYDFADRSGAPLTDIVLFYSVFSRGLELSKTNDRWRCAALKEVFGIDHDYGDATIDEAFRRMAGQSQDLTISNDAAGFVHAADPWFFPESYGADRRATDHLKHYARESQNPHVARLAKDVLAAGRRLHVVLPPGRADYRDQLPAPDALFYDLYALQRELGGPAAMPILDLFDHDAMNYEDFGDCDHLHPHGGGPAKAMRIIDEHLRTMPARNNP